MGGRVTWQGQHYGNLDFYHSQVERLLGRMRIGNFLNDTASKECPYIACPEVRKFVRVLVHDFALRFVILTGDFEASL